MKILFIHSPIRSFNSPSSSISEISGYLKNLGYITDIKDLNIDFYNEILTNENIENTYNLCLDIYSETNSFPYYGCNKDQILKYFDSALMKKILGKIEIAKNILKSDDFYDPVKYKTAHFIINTALVLSSLPYSTWITHERSILHNKNEFPLFEYKKVIKDKNNNIFYSYMEKIAEEIILDNYDSVCILVDIEGQIVSALTLATILKEKGQKNITLFGNYIPLVQNDIKADNTLFEEYADYMIYENHPIVFSKFAEFLENKKEIKEVDNLLYVEKGNVIENEYNTEKPTTTYLQDFEYIKKSDYLFPKIILPLSISDGCYWGKCKFCDLFTSKYTIKNLDNVINEIKKYKELYDAKYFFLRDLSFSPKISIQFAEKLIKNNINIRYSTFCRFEKEFDKKLLKLLYKSGLRCLNWGLESGCQKVLNTMNKGIDLKIVSRILKDCYDIGIGNKLSVMYNFPNETYDDFCETINFLEKHRKYIFNVVMHEFYLKRYSYIFNHMDEFGLQLNTDKVKWEYTPKEIYKNYDGQKYTGKLLEIEKINKLLRGGYDEIMLYLDKNPYCLKSWYKYIYNFAKTDKIKNIFD